MTPTERLRQRLIARLGTRFDVERRSLRTVGLEAGVGFNTLARFVRGHQITSNVFDRLDAALPRIEDAAPLDVERLTEIIGRTTDEAGLILSFDGELWGAEAEIDELLPSHTYLLSAGPGPIEALTKLVENYAAYAANGGRK